MGTAQSQQKYQELLSNLGKAGLNALFPNDFEYYMVALELVTSYGKSVDYFSFPINPSTIIQNEPQATNIKQNVGGITSLSTSIFIQRDITLSGDFGRKFKVLFKNKGVVDFSAFRFTSSKTGSGFINSLFDFKKASFNPSIKTGYGCIKVLQSICNKSVMMDDQGKPYKLYLYNPAIGDNFLVKVKNLKLMQDEKSNNMVWAYTLDLAAIAPMDGVLEKPKSSLLLNLGSGFVQRGVNKLTSRIKLFN